MRRYLLPCALAALCSGCLATQQDILGVQGQMDDLSAKIVSLQSNISTLQKNQADLSEKIDELNGNMTALSENLKDSRERMEQLGAKMDDVQAALGEQVQNLGVTLSKAGNERDAAIRAAEAAAAQAQAKANDIAAKTEAQQAALKALQDEQAKEEAQNGSSPTRIYRDAYVQYLQKNLDLASQGFALYLSKYPKGELADLATYYLGECKFAQKDYEDAAAEYAAVLENYRKSDLTPSARLQYARCLLRLKSHDPEGIRYLQSIVSDYPKSAEARTARAILRHYGISAASGSASGSSDQGD